VTTRDKAEKVDFQSPSTTFAGFSPDLDGAVVDAALIAEKSSP
jgi:hypothetical protein